MRGPLAWHMKHGSCLVTHEAWELSSDQQQVARIVWPGCHNRQRLTRCEVTTDVTCDMASSGGSRLAHNMGPRRKTLQSASEFFHSKVSCTNPVSTGNLSLGVQNKHEVRHSKWKQNYEYLGFSLTEREIILFQNPATDISIGKQNSNKICVKASHQIKTRCILMVSLLFKWPQDWALLRPLRSTRCELCSVLPCTMQRAHSQVIITRGESHILNISKTLNIELRLHFLIGKQNMRMGSLGLGLDTGTRNNYAFKICL